MWVCMSGSSSSLVSSIKELDAAGGRATDRKTPQFCGDIDMRIGRDGTWFYHGSPIGRKPLVQLFASVLRREANGEYWLVTPVERARIAVEDAPFTAVEVNVLGAGRERQLIFRTNLDENVIADAEHPIRVDHNPDTAEPRPYILIRDGLEARILRPVFYELVELAEPRPGGDPEIYGVWSRSRFFTLGRNA
jgi:hypothetical protein